MRITPVHNFTPEMFPSCGKCGKETKYLVDDIAHTQFGDIPVQYFFCQEHLDEYQKDPKNQHL